VTEAIRHLMTALEMARHERQLIQRQIETIEAFLSSTPQRPIGAPVRYVRKMSQPAAGSHAQSKSGTTVPGAEVIDVRAGRKKPRWTRAMREAASQRAKARWAQHRITQTKGR
jgi:hypothetical protein